MLQLNNPIKSIQHLMKEYKYTLDPLKIYYSDNENIEVRYGGSII